VFKCAKSEFVIVLKEVFAVLAVRGRMFGRDSEVGYVRGKLEGKEGGPAT
jgi:hypothetical protein